LEATPSFGAPISAEKWQAVLKKTTVKYHTAGTWVAVVFNLLFGLTDYFNIREHFETFFIFRLCISVIAGLLLLLSRFYRLSVDLLIFIPFLFISIQNAFMWSLMDAEHLQKHTMAYIALFIGAGMLVLWKINWSIAIVVVSIVANIVFLALNSTLGLEEIMVNGGLLTGSVMVFSIILIQTRFNLTKKEIIARLSLQQSNLKLNEQKRIIESKNENITASLTYAKKIQDAILPSLTEINKHLPGSFVYYRPRDIVSGDFYWYKHIDGISYLAAVDCTGHGVPGAFMSMIGNTILNKLIPKYNKPAQILGKMREEVILTLEKSGETAQKDGMDIAFCAIDHAKNEVQYAGAFNPFLLVRDRQLTEIKADRMPIGFYYFGDRPNSFSNHTMELREGDAIYLFSDGFQDQFGGQRYRKYSSRKFKLLLQSLYNKPSEVQHDALHAEFNRWKGTEEQLDDVLVVGVKYKSGH
jgi:sigma-B regulation protein RsbU (phosphoserine phosphatase)